jgi:hypothetical protein
MEDSRRRLSVLGEEVPSSPPSGSIYEAADRRLLARLFGVRNVLNREIVCMWNDFAFDHDWCVAVLRDADGEYFLCESLFSEEFVFNQVEPFSTKACARIANVMKNDEAPDGRHVQRLAELAAAADEASAAIEGRWLLDQSLWVRSELAFLGRGDAALHGYVRPGIC